MLEDLNSTNGVFIRSQRVKHQALQDGDVIQIGEHKLLYRDMRGGMPLVPVDDEDELDSLDDDDDDDDEGEQPKNGDDRGVYDRDDDDDDYDEDAEDEEDDGLEEDERAR